jgi:hypothetical protein
MFLYTFDLKSKEKLDKNFKFLHSIDMKDKTMYVYQFDTKFYSLFDKNDKSIFVTNKLFF